MQDHTAESVKSYEGYDVAWIEEARSLSQRSLTLLRPTIRKDGSEIWASWNPGFPRDPIDELLRGANPPPDAIVVEANWSHNPWFPKTLDEERQYDKLHRPDQYGHIWEGEYAKVYEGAYYADALALARKEGRLGSLAIDPLLPVYAFWDLGISDHTAIWIAQFVGREIRVVDHIEGQGQPLAFYVAELRARGYGTAECVLPHDGARRDTVSAVKFEDHLREAGFRVRTVANQGKGAARLRVEAARRLFPRIWIDAAKCQAGIEALGAYHERKDETRGVGLGPEHDWSSHSADAFGLLCVAYEEPSAGKVEWDFGGRGSSWLSA
jgi:phage terminase large subunit